MWIFPDIGFGGFQRYLRSLGKAVWGSMGDSDLELYRTRFIDTVKRLGLPVVNSVKLQGLTALAERLRGVENKWVKINRFRDNMETWKHIDYQHSERMLEHLALVFGPVKEGPWFVVQDEIKSEADSPVMEVGYDGWCITTPEGEAVFRRSRIKGYEAKNQLYLGSLLDYEDLPEEVRAVNEKFAPELARYGDRNFWATEIIIKDGQPHFIDPTARMAGQTMEHLLTTCTNLPKVINAGARGVVIAPEFSAPFAAEATLHYKGDGDGWKTFRVPEEAVGKVMLYRCCFCDGAYQFPPHKLDELGVVVGNGDTIEASIEDLKANFDLLQEEPVSIDTAGFADLLRDIKTAKEQGVHFTDSEIPLPEVALKE